MAATAVLTLAGCALGPDSRAVITRDGALGEPLPFVVALCGAAAMVCLVEPAPELTTTMPRRPWQTRAVRAGFVLAACTGAVAVTNLVAPGLTAATARNALLALTVTFLVALWQPLLSWVPTSTYLALSWFYGTATADDAARAWAVPAQPPDWPITGAWATIALTAAVVWVLTPRQVGGCTWGGGRGSCGLGRSAWWFGGRLGGPRSGPRVSSRRRRAWW